MSIQRAWAATRAPLPLVVIRTLAAADFAFMLRHPPLALAYFYNFPLAGAWRLPN